MTQLREARIRRGWTQSELIAHLRAAARETGRQLPADGTLRSMISRWEAGRHEPGALYRHLFDAVYEAGEMTGAPRTTTLRSHQFIPAWLGAAAAQEVVIGRVMTPGTDHRTQPHRWQAPSPTSECMCDLHVWPHGVAIFHVVEERSFSSLAALALWREQTYAERLTWATTQLQRVAVDARAAYVLSLYWLTASVWSGHDHDTAMRIMCMPRVLLGREDDDDGLRHARTRLAENALLAAKWDHPDIRSFGVTGTSSGYASWSGVLYHAQSTSVRSAKTNSCPTSWPSSQRGPTAHSSTTRSSAAAIPPSPPNGVGDTYVPCAAASPTLDRRNQASIVPCEKRSSRPAASSDISIKRSRPAAMRPRETRMRPVLVVVDVQNGFVRDASRHVVPVIAHLVDRWQHAGHDVIFTRYFNFPGSQYERLLDWTSLQGPPETDIVAQLAQHADRATAIVDKQIYSLFTAAGSELVQRHGWTDLYICGIATESCVLKTAADAFERGDLTPWIIEDASASHAGSAAHDAGLLVAGRFIGPSQIIRTTDVTTRILPPQHVA